MPSLTSSLPTETPDVLDCLVIGAGPAGLVAGLYLRRFHRRVAVLDAGNARALRIERSWNVPGFPQGISGPALLERLREQLDGVQGNVEAARIERLEHGATGGFAAFAGPRHWHARTVLLATGATDREPALPGARALREQGRLRQCPICDGHEHTGQRILVLGGGDHGAREALFLRHYAATVTLACTEDQPGCALPLRDTLQARGIVLLDAPATALLDDAGAPVTLEDANGHRHGFDVLYAALGSDPQAALAQPLGARLDDGGNLVIDAHGRTDVPGLYAAGDVTGGLDQISVAVGQAAIAATAIHNAL